MESVKHHILSPQEQLDLIKNERAKKAAAAPKKGPATLGRSWSAVSRTTTGFMQFSTWTNKEEDYEGMHLGVFVWLDERSQNSAYRHLDALRVNRLHRFLYPHVYMYGLTCVLHVHMCVWYTCRQMCWERVLRLLGPGGNVVYDPFEGRKGWI